jgi:hypothetical protein
LSQLLDEITIKVTATALPPQMLKNLTCPLQGHYQTFRVFLDRRLRLAIDLTRGEQGLIAAGNPKGLLCKDREDQQFLLVLSVFAVVRFS